MNPEKLINSVCSIAKTAGSFLRSEIHNISGKNIETKSDHDFVTYVDKASEKFLIQELTSLFPEAGIIAEESHQQKDNKRYHWIIDPLDGTTNYIHGMSPYAVSIALTDNEKEILGVVYEVGLDECFSAHINGKAFLNNQPIRVSETPVLGKSFIATGFPSRDYSKLQEYMELLKAVMFDTNGVRRLGSAATDIAYVACGRFDIFYEYHLSAWDVAAGAVLVKQAGGKVSDFSGKDNYLFGKEIITSNSHLHEEFLYLLTKFFDHGQKDHFSKI
ncbi:MAG TPA: inositol monophosphatase family protein [Bacteroidales bacterium]|nr:inositol monophosphatase family protein [Bacteroidales bacterium]